MQTSEILSALENTAVNIKALGAMVTVLLESGDNYGRIAWGVSNLFDREAADLTELLEKFRDDTEAGTPADLEATDPMTSQERRTLIFRRIMDGLEIEDVAKATNQTPQTVEAVLRAVVTIEPDQKAAAVEKVLEEAGKTAEPPTKRTGTKG
jgi:hypothetical protein